MKQHIRQQLIVCNDVSGLVLAPSSEVDRHKHFMSCSSNFEMPTDPTDNNAM